MNKKPTIIMVTFLLCAIFIAAGVNFFTEAEEETNEANTLVVYKEETTMPKPTSTPTLTPETNVIPFVDYHLTATPINEIEKDTLDVDSEEDNNYEYYSETDTYIESEKYPDWYDEDELEDAEYEASSGVKYLLDGRSGIFNLLEDDVYTYGTWQGEPIEWNVLESSGGYAGSSIQVLLITKYCIDVRPYGDGAVTWETSSLRQWLNNDFLNTAFTEDERLYIAEQAMYAEEAETGDYVHIPSGQNWNVGDWDDDFKIGYLPDGSSCNYWLLGSTGGEDGPKTVADWVTDYGDLKRGME